MLTIDNDNQRTFFISIGAGIAAGIVIAAAAAAVTAVVIVQACKLQSLPYRVCVLRTGCLIIIGIAKTGRFNRSNRRVNPYILFIIYIL